MKRIKQEDLERLCRRINVAMGLSPGTTEEAYALRYDYPASRGTVRFVKVSTSYEIPIIDGYYSKDELHTLMKAYLAGYEARVAQESHEQA
jgi:ribosome modulation factor